MLRVILQFPFLRSYSVLIQKIIHSISKNEIYQIRFRHNVCQTKRSFCHTPIQLNAKSELQLKKFHRILYFV